MLKYIITKIENILKGDQNKPDKKEWLDKLVENLEAKSLEDINLPFKIVKTKKTGFLVKVSGLYAFISFNNMPWKYNRDNLWTAIAPKLIGKIFFCKIHSITKEPLLSIIINGEVPQFKKTELLIGRKYKGIILNKTGTGILVDIGYHFNWKYGSFVGFLSKSQFNSAKLFLNCSVGDEIVVFYQGADENWQFLFTQNSEIFDWEEGIPQSLVGQKVVVLIVKEEKKEIKFLVEWRYNGKLIFQKNDPFFGGKKSVRKIKNNLKDGDIIHCEVIGFSEEKKILELKWIADLDSEIINIEDILKHNNENVKQKRKKNKRNDYEERSVKKYSSIIDYLDQDTIQKLIEFRDGKKYLPH